MPTLQGKKVFLSRRRHAGAPNHCTTTAVFYVYLLITSVEMQSPSFHFVAQGLWVCHTACSSFFFVTAAPVPCRSASFIPSFVRLHSTPFAAHSLLPGMGRWFAWHKALPLRPHSPAATLHFSHKFLSYGSLCYISLTSSFIHSANPQFTRCQ